MVTLDKAQQRKRNKLVRDFHLNQEFHTKRKEKTKLKVKNKRVKLKPKDIYDEFEND